MTRKNVEDDGVIHVALNWELTVSKEVNSMWLLTGAERMLLNDPDRLIMIKQGDELGGR